MGPVDGTDADRRPAGSDESGEWSGRGSERQDGSKAAHPPGGTSAGSPRPGVVDWLLVAFVTLLAAFTALVGVAYLPWHLGPVPVPVSALLGVAAMILAPRACFGLTGSMAAAALPVVAWFGLTVWLVLARNPMMLTQALSVVQGQWRVMVLLGLGSLAAAATLTLLWAERARVRYARADAEAAGDPASAAGDRPAEGVEADEPPVRST